MNCNYFYAINEREKLFKLFLFVAVDLSCPPVLGRLVQLKNFMMIYISYCSWARRHAITVHWLSESSVWSNGASNTWGSYRIARTSWSQSLKIGKLVISINFNCLNSLVKTRFHHYQLRGTGVHHLFWAFKSNYKYVVPLSCYVDCPLEV